MFKLQKHDMKGKAAVFDPPRGKGTLQPVPGHQQEAAKMQPELPHDRYSPVRVKVAVAAVQRHDEEVVDRAIKHVFTHVAPGRRGGWLIHPRPGKGAAHVGKT